MVERHGDPLAAEAHLQVAAIDGAASTSARWNPRRVTRTPSAGRRRRAGSSTLPMPRWPRPTSPSPRSCASAAIRSTTPQRAEDLSVDHPETVEHYREAHAISMASAAQHADTEDLRSAMVHYRALFDDLLEDTRHLEETI